MKLTTTISDATPSYPDMDYNYLRAEAIKYIQQLSGKIWTDHNIHDPGITTLELLSYAITDLGYRTEYAIKDLLAEKKGGCDSNNLYSATQILTCHPTTINDYRKMLLGIKGVKNAWLEPYKEIYYTEYVNGLYEVLIELEEEDRWGDLNSRTIRTKLQYEDHAFDIEISVVNELPWYEIESIENIAILDIEKDIFKYGDYRYAHQVNLELTLKLINGSTIKKILQTRLDIIGDDTRYNFVIPNWGIGNYVIAGDSEKRKRIENDWFLFVYSQNEEYADGELPLEEDDIELNMRTYKEAVLKLLTGNKFIDLLNIDYLPKQIHIASIIEQITHKLHENRNIGENFMPVKIVNIQEIAINAEIELDADAYSEAVLADIYLGIDEYLSPFLKKYSIDNLQEEGERLADILDGPLVEGGFVKHKELSSIYKKNAIYTAQLINIIMDVKGVRAVKSISLAHYISGLLNIENEKNGIGLVNPSLYLPRISINKSTVTFYKNNVSDNYNSQAVEDILQALKKKRHSRIDNYVPEVIVPQGQYLYIENYYSIQNDFPPVYGISESALDSTETTLRKAKAKQFKAYLLFFEQILADYLSQLSHLKDIFDYSANDNEQTYFFQPLTTVPNINNLYINYDNIKHDLANIYENKHVRLLRRNKFLDQLIGRFAEKFGDYAFLMYSLQTDQSTQITNLLPQIKPGAFSNSIQELSENYRRPLIDAIQRTLKKEIKEVIISQLLSNEKALKALDIIKDVTKEGILAIVEKNMKDVFPKSVNEGIDAGVKKVILEIIMDLQKDIPDTDLDSIEKINNILDEINDYVYKFVKEESFIVTENIKNVFNNAIKSGIIFTVEQSIEEVIRDIEQISSKKRSKKDEDKLEERIKNIIKTAVYSLISDRIKLLVIEAIRSIIQNAREYAVKEAVMLAQGHLIEQKKKFLQNYPQISLGRGNGLNCINTNRQSGFYNRICLLSGIDNSFANNTGEKFYIVEHILLLTTTDVTFEQLRIINQLKAILQIDNENNSYCSFKVSVIIPNNNGRFANNRFRSFFEKLLKIEAPAHILINCIWLDNDEIIHFAELYEKWLDTIQVGYN